MTTLNQEAMEYLRSGSCEVSYADRTQVVRSGEMGHAFYVVISGELEVVLASEEGRRLRLARLGTGSSFGEMSHLTGGPVSADVVALGPATVLKCPREHFRKALAECGPLRDYILTRLSNDLRRTNKDLWGIFQRAEAFSTLLQMDTYAGPIIAESPAMRQVQEQVAELASEPGPTLITGEPGTGQVYMAKKFHEYRGNPDAPLIVVDCLRLEEREASKLLFGSTNLEGFMDPAEDFGALHLADQGTFVLMDIEALDMTSQKILSQYLEVSAAEEGMPHIHLVATTSDDLASLAESGRFLPRLAEQLSTHVLKMPSMIGRKRDILPMAKLFLAERDQRLRNGESRLSRSAEHALLSGQYRNHNADELREAVEFAALVADGPEIGAEHIFTGPKSEGTPFDYNLSQVGLIQRLLRSKAPTAVLQSVIFAVFLSITLVCSIGGNSLPGRIANSLIWGLWWPGLMIVFLFIGRMWCTVCPISSAGYIAQRIGCLKMKPPQWLKKHAGWLVVLLFFLIIGSEQVFHMTAHPFRTSILLFTLMATATLFSVLYKREIWCRYLCPLGNFSATYAVSAMVYVRANPNVCATQCHTHECFKGSTTSRACPIFHHPLYARDGHFCKMCFSCLRSCPHESANLYLRPPIQSIWQLGDLSPTLTPLALVAFFMSLVLLGAHNTVWIATPFRFIAAAVLAVTMAIALHAALPRLLSQEHDPDPTMASRVALALLLLSWGPFMAFHLQEIPGLTALHIRVVERSLWTPYLPITEISLLPILQLAVIFLAAIFTMIALWQIWVRFIQQEVKPEPWGWRMLLGLCTLYLVTAVGLIAA